MIKRRGRYDKIKLLKHGLVPCRFTCTPSGRLRGRCVVSSHSLLWLSDDRATCPELPSTVKTLYTSGCPTIFAICGRLVLSSTRSFSVLIGTKRLGGLKKHSLKFWMVCSSCGAVACALHCKRLRREFKSRSQPHLPEFADNAPT
jgi:hypothetical protein